MSAIGDVAAGVEGEIVGGLGNMVGDVGEAERADVANTRSPTGGSVPAGGVSSLSPQAIRIAVPAVPAATRRNCRRFDRERSRPSSPFMEALAAPSLVWS